MTSPPVINSAPTTATLAIIFGSAVHGKNCKKNVLYRATFPHLSHIFLQNFPVQKYAKWPLTFVLSVKSLKVRTMSAADFPAYLPYKFSHLKFIKILSLRAMFPHLIHIFYKFFKCKIMCEKAVYICTIRRKTLRIATTSRTDIWGLFFGWIFLLEICKKNYPILQSFSFVQTFFANFSSAK